MYPANINNALTTVAVNVPIIIMSVLLFGFSFSVSESLSGGGEENSSIGTGLEDKTSVAEEIKEEANIVNELPFVPVSVTSVALSDEIPVSVDSTEISVENSVFSEVTVNSNVVFDDTALGCVVVISDESDIAVSDVDIKTA